MIQHPQSQLFENINTWIEAREYDVKVTLWHQLWWLRGFEMDGSAQFMLVDNDDVVRTEYLDTDELQDITAQVFSQGSLSEKIAQS
jgi:hypothetical protein